MSAATITSKGQITIPKEIRLRLDLHAGDKVNFIIDDSNRVNFLPVTLKITSLKGLIAKPEKSVSIDEMKATIRARGRKR